MQSIILVRVSLPGNTYYVRCCFRVSAALCSNANKKKQHKAGLLPRVLSVERKAPDSRPRKQPNTGTYVQSTKSPKVFEKKIEKKNLKNEKENTKKEHKKRKQEQKLKKKQNSYKRTSASLWFYAHGIGSNTKRYPTTRRVQQLHLDPRFWSIMTGMVFEGGTINNGNTYPLVGSARSVVSAGKYSGKYSGKQQYEEPGKLCMIRRYLALYPRCIPARQAGYIHRRKKNGNIIACRVSTPNYQEKRKRKNVRSNFPSKLIYARCVIIQQQ